MVLVLCGCVVHGESIRVTTASGTGFIVDPNGYVLTNEHVVRDATDIEVLVGASQVRFEATVLAVDTENDLALLKIPASRLPTVELGDSDEVRMLAAVVAMGYPAALTLGADLTVAEGQITAIRTNMPGRQGKDTFQTDAAIYHGSSGGPLFDVHGNVVGVNYAGIEGSQFYFAIPINDATPLLRRIPGYAGTSTGASSGSLSSSEILDRAAPAVVFIRVEIERALSSFLPTTILGTALEEGDAAADASFPTADGREGLTVRYGYSKYGDVSRHARIIAEDMQSPPDARAALSALYALYNSTPLSWFGDLPYYHPTDGAVLLRDTRDAGGVTVELLVEWGIPVYLAWVELPGWHTPGSVEERTIPRACLLQGRVAFALEDLAFEGILCESVDVSDAISVDEIDFDSWNVVDGCLKYTAHYSIFDLTSIATPLCVARFLDEFEEFVTSILQAVTGL